MPFFAHPDIFWINAGPSNITNNVFNIYNYHGDEKNIHLFKYPPFAYFTLASQHLIFKPFLSSFEFFENTNDIHSYNQWFESENIFQNLFFLKLFYLAADIFILIFILKLQDKKPGQVESSLNRLTGFWAFSPFIIYSAYMYGQYDILPVALIFYAFYLFKNEKYNSAFFIIGLAGALKHFPFLIAPVFFFAVSKNIIGRIKYFFLTIAPYIIIALFFINSESFIRDVFLNSSDYITQSKLFIAGYIVILLLFLFNKKKEKNINSLIKFSFMIFAWYLICLEKFNPQFIIWLAPFLCFFAAGKSKSGIYLYLILIPVYFIYITYLGVNSTNKLLLPMDNDITMLPSVNSIITHYLKINYNIIIRYSKYIFNIILLLLFFVNIRFNEDI